jgi:hypothetical protein
MRQFLRRTPIDSETRLQVIFTTVRPSHDAEEAGL